MAVSSAAYGWMALNCAAYGAMVTRSASYGATVCSCGPAAMTPAIAAWLAAIVASSLAPVAPPPRAATACACRALLVGSACSLVNRAGLAWIACSSGANFCAFASWVLYWLGGGGTDGGVLASAARAPRGGGGRGGGHAGRGAP